MSCRLGLSSYAYYWACRIQPNWLHEAVPMTPEGLVDQVKSLGLEVLQICENLPLLKKDRSELERLGESARRQGVILEVGARGLDVDSLLTCLEITRIVDAHLLRLVPWSGSETRRQLPINQLRSVVDQLLPVCRKHAITLAIENYFDLSDETLAAFVKEVSDELVGICLDTANSAGALQKPMETVELLAPYTVSLHLKDFVVTKPTMGYAVSGVPLGQGWLNSQEILDVIHQAGRQPNVLLELWVDPAENDEATLRKEDQWVRQSVNYAREHLTLIRMHMSEIHH